MFFYYQQVFSYDEIQELNKRGFIVDGREGGLVIGRSHAEGGIYFLIDMGTHYELHGEMEGFEYLLSISATTLLQEDFDELNNRKRDLIEPFEIYTPGPKIKVIDTGLKPGLDFETKLILLEGRGNQAIVNKHSTKKYLTTIDEINQSYFGEYDSEDFFNTRTLTIKHRPTGGIVTTRQIIWKENL